MTGAILVVGQSHVAAIRAAARTRREHDPDRPRTRVIHTLEARYVPELADDQSRFAEPLASDIRDQIGRHDPLVVSCIGGNIHNVLALIRHPRPFDFFLSGEVGALDPNAEPLAEALVRAALIARMGRDLLRLRLLAEMARPFVHLESPPPLADATAIARQADAFFRDRGIMAADVAPAGLRHRIWRLHSRIVAETCDEIGVRFLPVPAAAMDEAGFFRPEYAGDATHGNEAYGELLIRMLEDRQ